MRPQYFRGKAVYKFNFTGTDQTKSEIGVAVDEHGEFDLSQQQFSKLTTIGVYANPLHEAREPIPAESDHVLEPEGIEVRRTRVDIVRH